jgi:hypothetical protein
MDLISQGERLAVSFSRDTLADVTTEVLRAEDNLTEFEVFASSTGGAPFAFHTFPAPTIIETPSTADGITVISIVEPSPIERRIFYRLQITEDSGED